VTSNEVHDIGEFQTALCEARGGRAEVRVQHASEGIESVTVVCHGGVYDGMVCLNDTSKGTMCQGAFPHSTPQDAGSHIWQIDTVIPILEAGSLQQLNAILTDLEAASASVPDLASPASESGPAAAPTVENSDDRHHDTGNGKKGKKGGKGRR
jgi:hypothetical protein